MKNNIGATHYRQLFSYAECAEADGWYYGQKKHFEKRHLQIVAFLKEAIERCEKKQPKGTP